MSSTACLVLAAALLAMAAGCHDDHGLSVARGVPHLFVDDVLIDSAQDLERTLHQPVKDYGGNRPVIAAKEGTTLLAYGSIVRDTSIDRYVMFVQEFPSRQMYRFVSPDGLDWVGREDGAFQPVELDLNLQQQSGTRGSPGIDVFSCYYDEKDAEYPYKGWVYAANYGFDREGIYFVKSRTGLQWQRGSQVVSGWAGPGDKSARVIDQDGRRVYGPGDVTLFWHDATEDRFLGLFKFFTTDAVADGNHLRSRAYAFMDRIDRPFDVSRIERVALLPPATDEGHDTRYDEYYASTAWRYGDMWLGGLKVWHSKGDYPYSAAGCAFLKLVSSRDGLHWTKVPYDNDDGVPEVFVPNGPEGGNDGRNDGGYISEFSQGPLRIGDEIVYYYSASSYGKSQAADVRIRGGGIFRARLRPDGFVSVSKGILTTKPLRFEGKDLYLNAKGPVEVEILTAGGRVLGRSVVRDDSPRQRVMFDARRLEEICGSSSARLRFRVAEAGRLYAFGTD